MKMMNCRQGKTVRIRQAGAEEMLRLWGYQSEARASPTARFFHDNITSGNAVFWALDVEGELIGELYAFLNVGSDKDFADGIATAYLCAFRVKKEYRGQGLGSRLMEAAIADLKNRGFLRATIGVDDERNEKLYHRMGFTEEIKECRLDPCAMDENMRPESVGGFLLLSRDLRAL